MELQFISWINQLREIFPQLEDPNNLMTLEDCSKWFKDYKKVVKSINQEWDYCKETLKALNKWESKLTKNQAYLKENSLMINNLYSIYIIGVKREYRVYYVKDGRTRTRFIINPGTDISDEDLWTTFLNFNLKANEEPEDFDAKFIKLEKR